MPNYAGIDVGSLSTDGVLIDGDDVLIADIVIPTGPNMARGALDPDAGGPLYDSLGVPDGIVAGFGGEICRG